MEEGDETTESWMNEAGTGAGIEKMRFKEMC